MSSTFLLRVAALLAAFGAVAYLGSTACSRDAARDATSPLVVAAAVSLREPLAEILDRFAAGTGLARPDATLGASSALAAQIRAGAPIDVFVSADARIVTDLEAAGLLDPATRVALARNRLVVIATDAVVASLSGPDALASANIRRIAVAHDGAPVGHYARGWLASRGLLDVLRERLVATEHARASLAAVDLGHVDAAIVYATDARVARAARLAFEVPAHEQPQIVYAAARVARSRRPAEAARLLEFLSDRPAQEILARAGFSPVAVVARAASSRAASSSAASSPAASSPAASSDSAAP